MHLRFLSGFLVSLVLPILSLAQSSTTISLSNWSSFHEQKRGDWLLTKDLAIHPFKEGKPMLQKGTGVLVGSAGSSIATKQAYSNLQLSTEFILSPKSLGSIVLPGGIKIVLSEQDFHLQTDATTTGYTGIKPTQNLGKKAGLWQKIEINYDTEIIGHSGYARINWLKINGVTAQQNAYLPLLSNPTGPLEFTVDKGHIGFKNINCIPLLDKRPVSIADLHFKRYSDKWDAEVLTKLEEEASAPLLTQEYGQGATEFHLVFDGNLVAEEAGEYEISLMYTGSWGELTVNGKTLAKEKEYYSQYLLTNKIQLQKGKNPFTLRYSKLSWRSPALGLTIGKDGIRTYALHKLSSLPEPDPQPRIMVTPITQPEMIRSFIVFDKEENKRTHCLSVGTPEGWHYTTDLNKGTLLQVWRGEFANVTEMWHSRGEPQLLMPEGLLVALDGKSNFVSNSTMTTTWPDSSDFNFKGYYLDTQQLPEIEYQNATSSVYDKLSPIKEGLKRTIRVTGNPVTCYVANASKIEQVDKELYRINDNYYIRLTKGDKATIRTVGERQELLLSIDKNRSYDIIW